MKFAKIIACTLLLVAGVYLVYMGVMLCLATALYPFDGQSTLGIIFGAPLVSIGAGLLATCRALFLEKQMTFVMKQAFGGASVGFGLAGLLTLLGAGIVILANGAGYQTEDIFGTLQIGAFFSFFLLVGFYILRNSANPGKSES